jgi:hypothetical protein
MVCPHRHGHRGSKATVDFCGLSLHLGNTFQTVCDGIVTKVFEREGAVNGSVDSGLLTSSNYPYNVIVLCGSVMYTISIFVPTEGIPGFESPQPLWWSNLCPPMGCCREAPPPTTRCAASCCKVHVATLECKCDQTHPKYDAQDCMFLYIVHFATFALSLGRTSTNENVRTQRNA